MAPGGDQATLIILDIGKNVAVPDGKGDLLFFHKARDCVKRIIERKIMCQAKDLIGIILLGTKKTKNNMASECEGAFRHIELHVETQIPNWQMIRNLPNEPSASKGDWIDSLIVAADHIKNGITGLKLSSKKIILMTNFQAPSKYTADIELVVNGLKEEDFEVDVIGSDIYDESEKNEEFELAKHFVEATKGVTATFDDAMRYLLFNRKKATKPMPWNVDLSIGPNIKIPVSAFVRLRDEPIVKNWMKAIKDPITGTASTTEGIFKNKIFVNNEDQSIVKEDQLTKGFVYGQRVIPFSNCDNNMLYKSGEKCLSVYGFTDAKNLQWQSLKGEGLSYVFGRKGNKKAQSAIKCLVECLLELNLVGIVKRVYNRGNAPKMFALMPVIDPNNYICLSMAEICFKEAIKYMAFPPTNVKRFSCSRAQVDAFKDLIKSMDLTMAYDDTFDDGEAFPIAETVSPTAQYILDCIAFRALNPDKPLPQPRDDIMLLFKRPALIEKRAKDPIEKLKQLFTLNKVEIKTREKKKPVLLDALPIMTDSKVPIDCIEDMPKLLLPQKQQKIINRIGTIDPIQDFNVLFNQGKTLSDLAEQMTKAIEDLVFGNLDGNYSKACETIAYFRAKCVTENPSHYNNWLQKFKIALIEREKKIVLNLFEEKKLKFITKDENNMSTIDNENSQDDSIYECDTVPDYTELSINTEVNDLFDEM